MRLRTREEAAAYLNEQGALIKGDGLKDHASRGTGPAYSIVNGRAVYTEAALDAWIAEQMARPVRRRSPQAAA